MSWESLNIPELPQEISDVLTSLDSILEDVETAIDTLREPLNLALQFIDGSINPALLLFQAILKEARSVIQQLGDSSLFWLTLHPWTGEVGTIGDTNPYLLELNSANFIAHLASSLTDAGDPNKPTGNGIMVVFAMGATTPSGFVTALRAVANLLDLSEFRTLANRVEALGAVELVPMQVPSVLPDWSNAGRLHSLIPPLGSLILQTDALLESFEMEATATQIALKQLEELLKKKKAQISQATDAINKLQESLRQDFSNVHLLVTEGPFSQSITAEGFPQNYRYCAGVAIAGSTVDIQPLMKLLGKA